MIKYFNLEENYENIRLMVESILEIVDGAQLSFVTIIPYPKGFEIGKLKDFDIKNCKRRLARILKKCSVPFAVGVIEFSTRKFFKFGKKSTLWSPHIHLFCSSSVLQKESIAKLRKSYNKSNENSLRSVDIRLVYSLNKLIRYMTKNPAKKGRITRVLIKGRILSLHGRLPAPQKDELEQYLADCAELPDGKGSPIFARGVMRRGDGWAAVAPAAKVVPY